MFLSRKQKCQHSWKLQLGKILCVFMYMCAEREREFRLGNLNIKLELLWHCKNGFWNILWKMRIWRNYATEKSNKSAEGEARAIKQWFPKWCVMTPWPGRHWAIALQGVGKGKGQKCDLLDCLGQRVLIFTYLSSRGDQGGWGALGTPLYGSQSIQSDCKHFQKY